MKKMMLLLIVLATMLSAAIVPVDRAKTVAENYYQNYAPFDAKGNIVEKILTKEYLGQPTWYVVKFTKGFVIVAADDNVMPILGYSFDGDITEDLFNMKNPFANRFSMYDKQIVHNIREKGVVRPSQQKEWKNIEDKVFPQSSKAAVGPLVITKWHQDAPFSNNVPVGCPVGCVATAMAQIMRYYQGPDVWNGTHSYTDLSGSTTGSHSVTSATYTWSLMQGIYAADFTTTEQKAEVAELNYTAAVSVNMDFETGGSAASLSTAVQALKDHFKFSDTGVWENWGSITDSAAYNVTIKANIDAGHPMELAGYNSDLTEGHAYVLSGYDNLAPGGYWYHFNWGWGGAYDGWFRLNDLTPGISDFSFNQQAGYNLFVDGLIDQMPPPATCTGGANTAGDVTVNWTVPTPVSPMGTLIDYKVYRNGALIKTMGGTGTRTYLDPARPEGAYEYYVKAVYNNPENTEYMGISPISPSYFVSIVPDPSYPVPVGMLAEGMDDVSNQYVRSKVDLTWAKPFVGVTYVYDGFEGNTGNEYINVPIGWIGKHNTGTVWPPPTWVATTGSAGWVALGPGYNEQYSFQGDWSAAALGSGNNYKMMFFNTVKNLVGNSGTFIKWWTFTYGPANLKALLYAGTTIPATLVPANLKTIGQADYLETFYGYETKFTVPVSNTGNHFIGICSDGVSTDSYSTIDEFRCGYDTFISSGNPAGQPVSYQIYRNSALVTTVTATSVIGETYADTGFDDGYNEYFVRAIYAAGNSIASNPEDCWMDANPQPYFLSGTYDVVNDIADISWYAPGHYPPHWFAWEYETDSWNYLDYAGIGTGNVTLARTYFNAQTFGMGYPVHLTDISCAFLKYVDDPAWESNQFRYAVGTGKDDVVTYLHTSANLTALEDGSFIDYTLPVQLDLNEDWFVEVQFVDLNSCDPCPMTFVHEEGNGIGWNSVWYWTGDGVNYDPGYYAFTYTSPYEYEDFMIYCYGWNDEPTYTKSAKTQPDQVAGKTIKNKKAFGPSKDAFAQYVPHSKKGARVLKDSDNSKGLANYKVYRNGSSITTTTNKTYSDTTPIMGDNTYYITAVYTSPAGESIGSNQITLGPPPSAALPASVSESAPPAGSTTDAFNIGNTGKGDLHYAITNAYVGYEATGGTEHSNDFTTFPGTGYTASVWIAGTGTAYLAGAKGGVTGVLTSPIFSTVGKVGVYLDFTQTLASYVAGSYAIVEYYTGSTWTEILRLTANSTAAQHLELPTTSASTQLRFTGYLIKEVPNTCNWTIDNIVVTSQNVPYSWLSFNGGTEAGTVLGLSSGAVNYTCTSGALVEGDYTSNMTIVTNDAANDTTVVLFTFTVGSSPVVPAVPTNFATSLVGGNVYMNWDDAADATSYDVYSSDTPYGTYALLTNVAVSEYTYTPAEAKKFFYIVSKNATKTATPRTIEIARPKVSR